MSLIDPNAQYSILGTSVRVDRVEGQTVVLHAPLRLGPGRSVAIRTGSTTFQAMVLHAHVFALHGEQGATYEIQAEIGSPACPAGAPEGRRRTVELDASKKGGGWRAA